MKPLPEIKRAPGLRNKPKLVTQLGESWVRLHRQWDGWDVIGDSRKTERGAIVAWNRQMRKWGAP